MQQQENETSLSRRDFLHGSAASAATALLATGNYAFAQGSSRLKVGLIGCGGRGTGAALQALSADPEVVLHAMGDVFQSQIDGSLAALKGESAVASRVQVKPERCYVGLDCYLKVLDSGVDVVLLASPPGFRPREIRAAIAAGKHIFAEKPMGTDAVNVRAALEAAREIPKKKLAFVAGFCWRYEPANRAFFRQIHEGAIGRIRHYHATYLAGPVKPMPPASTRPAGMSDVEWQVRNWYNFVWLSGDGLVEQACHSVDKILWAMKDTPPAKCVATGGRMVPNNEGNIYDHISVFYEWPDGTRATMAQRQITCGYYDNSDYIYGTRGEGIIRSGRPTITAEKQWRYTGESKNMYQVEHDELFASIRSGKPINDAPRMAISTLVAIMGRMAAYTGEEVTWEHVMQSRENLFPDPLNWDMKLPIAPMAVPGQTRLI
ncbi:MAG: Gfo/Idh/MocA family oxidoreductase [Chloroherpetonaceae bacterium]|nr:Gfo/Idh/MocA family oxidoreductase [Chthonomonadaceae bacterium]MDW8209426.1 Gfo/Idh/MocA family oxidoreductase [Chloroherpetonaceae bacterium]